MQLYGTYSYVRENNSVFIQKLHNASKFGSILKFAQDGRETLHDINKAAQHTGKAQEKDHTAEHHTAPQSTAHVRLTRCTPSKSHWMEPCRTRAPFRVVTMLHRGDSVATWMQNPPSGEMASDPKVHLALPSDRKTPRSQTVHSRHSNRQMHTYVHVHLHNTHRHTHPKPLRICIQKNTHPQSHTFSR